MLYKINHIITYMKNYKNDVKQLQCDKLIP